VTQPAPMALPRRILLVTLAALLSALTIELFSITWLWLSGRGIGLLGELREARAYLLDPEAFPGPPSQSVPLQSPNAEVLHPYLGFVVDPSRRPGYTVHGLPASGKAEAPPGGAPFTVAVFGGSFAEGMVREAGGAIEDAVREEIGGGRGPVSVQAFAIGGYKQPQQLLALAYFLSLGERFDVVVNLDGFNEVALPGAENGEMVFPFYPRGWPARVSNFIDPRKLSMVATLAKLDEEQKTLARRFSAFPISVSPTANLVWRSLQRGLGSRRSHVSQELDRLSGEQGSRLGYLAAGPGFHYGSDGELYDALAGGWMRASLAMHQLAVSNGIPYLHFLQPNQYVPGSKPLTAAERANAWLEDHPYRRGVEAGYPLLVRRGRELGARGVSFHDLSGIFRGSERSLYADTCCHVNAEGYAIVAAEIGREVALALGRAPRHDP